MGWANCGTDSNERPIGYGISAICDHPGCNKEIDRGLAYVCGTMHGNDEISCEKYFCHDHKSNHVQIDEQRSTTICDKCANELLSSEDFAEDDFEGAIVRIS